MSADNRLMRILELTPPEVEIVRAALEAYAGGDVRLDPLTQSDICRIQNKLQRRRW